jgi:UDP-glucose 4-epimerase
MLADHPGAAGDVFNIGTDEEVTITELAERIIEMTGSASRVEYIPYEEAFGPGFEDMPRRVPDLGKIQDLVGYRPEMSLEGLLSHTIQHIRQERSAPKERVTENRLGGLPVSMLGVVPASDTP